MPCYRPLEAYESGYVNADGSRRLVFNPAKAKDPREGIQLPCGSCIGCRLDYARDWSIRCYHESQEHVHNSFITLTYAPEHLPPDGGLNPKHFQVFMKKLRRKLSPVRIRFFMCGEYGEELSRPHYHALIFGYDFPDKFLKFTRNGKRHYESPELNKLWAKGICTVSAFTFETANYTARYILKKQKGYGAKDHYSRQVDGEEIRLQPEYTRMSLKPGIGETWFQKYWRELYPSDQVVMPNGRTAPVPRYYDKLLQRMDPDLLEEMKQQRIEKARNNPNNAESRLATREKCTQARVKRLPRKYEDSEP